MKPDCGVCATVCARRAFPRSKQPRADSLRSRRYNVARVDGYSTVTLLARLRGWSTSQSRISAMWQASSCAPENQRFSSNAALTPLRKGFFVADSGNGADCGKKRACLQRREWNSGPFGAIDRLPGGSCAVRVATGPGWKGVYSCYTPRTGPPRPDLRLRGEPAAGRDGGVCRWRARQRDAVDEIVCRPLRALQGSVSAEHGIGLEKKAYLGYTRSDAEIELMRKTKRMMDSGPVSSAFAGRPEACSGPRQAGARKRGATSARNKKLDASSGLSMLYSRFGDMAATCNRTGPLRNTGIIAIRITCQ